MASWGAVRGRFFTLRPVFIPIRRTQNQDSLFSPLQRRGQLVDRTRASRRAATSEARPLVRRKRFDGAPLLAARRPTSRSYPEATLDSELRIAILLSGRRKIPINILGEGNE